MSNSVKPALGRSFSHYIDLHILLSKLPKRKADAQLMYAEAEVDVSRSHLQRQVQTVNVAEIITDRWDGRIGRWCGFTIDDGVVMKAVRL